MNKLSNHRHQILGWMLGAFLVITPGMLASPAQAQQDQPQQNQSQENQAQPGQPGNWGPAGPPPDAENGEVPPPPPETQNGAATPAPPPPPQVGYGQAGRVPYQPYANQQPQVQPRAQEVLPTDPVTIQAGTPLQARTTDPLDTKKFQPGDYFQATLAQNVYLGNMLAIPRGAHLMGQVVDVRKPGELKGGASLTLRLTSMNLAGHTYPLESSTWSFNGPGKGAYTAGNAVGGAVLGSVIGAIAGGGPGAAVGAVAGTGAGLGASAATPGPRGVIPSESVLTFRLTKPVTVQPVTREEAEQLENSMPPEQRGPQYGPGYGPGYGRPYGYAPAAGAPPPPPYYYPAPYAYGYPPPYPYVYAYPYPYWYYRRWR